MHSVRNRSQLRLQIFFLILLCAGVIIAMSPMAYMVSTAFKRNAYTPEFPLQFIPNDPTLDNFDTAFNSRNFDTALFNSVRVAVATSALVTILTSMMAYAFARFDFFGKNLIFYTILAMMMVPTMMLIIPQFLVAKKLDLLNSLNGLVLVYSAGAMAFNMFLLRGFFEGLPRELEESALIDGANHFVIFTRIMIPLAKPALSTVAVFSFLGAWDEYIWALTVLTDVEKRTLPIAIANFRGVHSTDWGLIFAASLTAVIPTLIIFIVFQRYFVQGITTGAVKG
ncbi:MAG: carbohydrate ABC transporter permease [Chloroflexi bacterium]|nr:carbohydrate ABC transporter permease [Chloroflexota bacterium]